jgi:carbamate kinase
VPSPLPKRIFEIRPIKWLLEKGAVVICTGGGGVPTMYGKGTKRLIGAEVVIDKDRASALLARDLEADLFVMATDVDGVYLDFGTPQARRLEHVSTTELAGKGFAAGSMGPKVEAAVDFAERTGKRAAIGTLAEIGGVVAGTHGTSVTRG